MKQEYDGKKCRGSFHMSKVTINIDCNLYEFIEIFFIYEFIYTFSMELSTPKVNGFKKTSIS